MISLSKDVRSLQDNVIRTNVHDNQLYSHVEGQLTFSDDDLERMNQYLVNSSMLFTISHKILLINLPF